MTQNVLLCDDDIHILRAAEFKLAGAGYDTRCTHNGREAWDEIQRQIPDLLITDLQMPEMDGLELIQHVRGNPDTAQLPIIMLTAKTSDDEIIQGLKLGADDYVAKPFSIQQLVLRIEAFLRRSQVGLEQARTINLDNVEIDTENLTGLNGREEITFTRREIEVLSYLAQHPDRPISREELLLKVWGYARNLDIETRTVDIHIAKLRRKIEADPKAPQNLVTVRGAGYRLVIAGS